LANTSTHPGRRGGLGAKLRNELKNFFWIFVYLFIVFGFYTLSDEIFRRDEGLDPVMHGFAAINALVFAKVILVGDELKLGQWLRRSPLAYSIALESFVFTLLLIAFHFLEHAAVAYFRHGSPAVKLDVGGGGWLGLAIVAAMMFFALIPFFAYRNLSRLIGPENFHALLFRVRRG
jgi:hypothetical protein